MTPTPPNAGPEVYEAADIWADYGNNNSCGERYILLSDYAALRQGYWDARAIMGFDNDGCPTPEARVSDFAAMMLDDAKSMRADYDESLAELTALEARLAEVEAWRPIETAPHDGTEFQAWFGRYGWEPRCMIDEDTNALCIWGRTDYDQDGWDTYPHMVATHWMPQPVAPAALTTQESANG